MKGVARSQGDKHRIKILPAKKGSRNREALHLSDVREKRFACPVCQEEVMLVLEEVVAEFTKNLGPEADIEDANVFVRIAHLDSLALSTGEVGPDVLEFGFDSHSSNQSKTLQEVITNDGNQPLTWNATITYTTQDRGWLRLDQTTGTVPANAQQTVGVTVDTDSLADGQYLARIHFTSNGTNAVVTALMVIGIPVGQSIENQGGPKISPSSLNFGTFAQGSGNPSPLKIWVTNNDSKNTLSWRMTSMSGGTPWLSLSQASGSVPPGSQRSVNVNASIGSLARGSYLADVFFNLKVGTYNVNTMVAVSLTIQ